MKKISVVVAVVFVLFSFFAALSFAAEKGSMEKGSSMPMMGQTGTQMEHLNATRVLGKNLLDEKGDKLGKISDLVISPDGRVTYAIIAHEEAATKLSPVPWRAVREGTGKEKNEFTISINKERFAQAPSFTRDHWPRMNDPKYESEVFGYYGVDSGRPAGAKTSPE